MARLIDADALGIGRCDPDAFPLQDRGYCAGWNGVISLIEQAPTVDAVPVVRGWWKGYTHSALVRWKDGEPVWEDRNVYRCGRCDFGTIVKHNYCPRCGAKMDGDRNA